MTTPHTFRNATLADAPLIAALVESAYRGDASRAGWTTEADFLHGRRTDATEITELLASGNGRFVLLERDGTLAASCYIERQGVVCYFGMFSVHPPLQGSGIGRLVMAEAERIAREEWTCERVEMTVIDIRDELIAWYERRGYARTGRTKAFPYGDERFGLPQRDDLRFEYLVKELA
ncbi:GNAT family N-acetyltransferase [Luteibacter anthropi]|uniref:GNAT family N-acetyltransferase n=1 Tax=Luteibacter anthropi TaxID=564369 RepID=A0A7X5ZIA0_9GAMM|nr:GNAT family N-acetyltransferase [Luteibacter anthropi]NII06559.1 GNAT family N-acetyltransferase [Luteibacter anthropi]URX60768.1 GNAT family N-acetyltransferase [Luteibacter anthropi]